MVPALPPFFPQLLHPRHLATIPEITVGIRKMHYIKWIWNILCILKTLAPLCYFHPSPFQATHQIRLFSPFHPCSRLQSEVSTCDEPKPSVPRFPQNPQFPMVGTQMVFTVTFFPNSFKHKMLTLCSYDESRNKPFLGSWEQENILCFCFVEHSLEMPCLIF